MTTQPNKHIQIQLAVIKIIKLLLVNHSLPHSYKLLQKQTTKCIKFKQYSGRVTQLNLELEIPNTSSDKKIKILI